MTFLHIEGGLAQHVLDKLEPGIATMARNREDRGEGCLQAIIDAPFGQGFRLQESRKRLDLGGEQERRIEHGRALGEALADTLFLSVGIRHGCSG
ncbi:hypothetical protein SDC9_154109 [bioreactor metagenome]|uniref:Uncharacterized protein n=1 Tax=bioreactor metagenome TaxID=1076179 RepID=A0A645F026_9ZZZZ